MESGLNDVETRYMKEGLLHLFPEEKRPFWKKVAMEQDKIEEIRLRAGKPICIRKGGKECYLDSSGDFLEGWTSSLEGQIGDLEKQSGILEGKRRAYCVDEEEMEAMLQHVCHYSLYAFEDELKQGFITVAGGHRIGLAGQVVLNDDGSVRTIKHIYYMNIRISHQIKGAADSIIPCLYQGSTIKNTLIISPPGCGKTTLLRDMVRQISDGSKGHPGLCVGLVDERSEIAGSYMGHPQNDVGMRTDVLDACPKVRGMMMLLRSMAPQVIAVDELGGEEDMKALHMAAACGCRMIATVHGEDIEDVAGRLGREEFMENGLFDLFLVLSRKSGMPVILDICKREEIYASHSGRNHDTFGVFRNGNLV